jgi:DNA-binding XRE family transcriptional regulator
MSEIQIIRSPTGEELVVLSRADYDALIAARDEDDDDVAIFDARKAELAEKPKAMLPPEVSALLLRGDSRLKAIRRWRDMTQSELASRAGIGQGFLSEIEAGHKAGARDTLEALATALDIPLDWIA